MLWLVAGAALGEGPARQPDIPLGDAAGEADLTASVALAVAVHREAGTIYDVAVDGAAGQCSVTGSVLRCPARGPVRFRWGPDERFEIVGDAVLEPGGEGRAVVWAVEAERAVERERLAVGRVTAQDVRDLFVRTGDHPIPVPSAGMFADLLALVEHPDYRVRREVIDALVPYWRHTASDPFPLGAPDVVPESVLVALARDPDDRVRRRTAFWLREVRAPGEPLSAEATELLLELGAEGGGVQRAAFASLASRARDGRAPAVEAWEAAMARVTSPGPPGRAAASTLGALADELEPGPGIDPVRAVVLVVEHHTERAWMVWRRWAEAVPFDARLAERLLRETEGMSPGLIRRWADDDPEGLARLLTRWEPGPPHSERYRMAVRALGDRSDPALRALLGDNLSPEAAGGESQ